VVKRRSSDSGWNNLSFAPVQTPNGNGWQLSYNFAGHPIAQ
jgi:hypothetical protein